MSGQSRHVKFSNDLEYSRPATNIETELLTDFVIHQKRCSYCHLNSINGVSCRRGRNLIAEILRYVLFQEGYAISVKDLRKDKLTRIEFPDKWMHLCGHLARYQDRIERSQRDGMKVTVPTATRALTSHGRISLPSDQRSFLYSRVEQRAVERRSTWYEVVRVDIFCQDGCRIILNYR